MKTAFITGASRGIGKQTAIKFAKEGFSVVAVYNKNKAMAEELISKLKDFGVGAIAVAADVSDKNSIFSAYEAAKTYFHHIDTLVNCAGVSLSSVFQDVSETDLKKIIDVNLLGTMYATQAVLPDMIARKAGSIINVSSMWGLTGASLEVVYSASKAGVIGFTKALAKEVAPSFVRVNCVAPGAILTDMLSCYTKSDLQAIADETPLMRLGTPEEIADAIYFLSTQNFITGQILSVDGGMVI